MEAAGRLVRAINDTLINPILALLFITALFMFLLGLTRFMRAEAGSQDRTKGKQHMLWGIIGMVAMVSVYSIFALFLRTFGVDPASQIGPINLSGSL